MAQTIEQEIIIQWWVGLSSNDRQALTSIVINQKKSWKKITDNDIKKIHDWNFLKPKWQQK